MFVTPLITLTSDFGVQTQGVGAMEAIAFSIAPQARLIHLMHGLPEFNTIAAARTLEGLKTFPVGFHVCVCDPGVGTSRLALALKVARGDILIGPDNGVLLPAARLLGGIKEARSIENPKVMREEVSPIFHGRDLFVPTAAHLANGSSLQEVGPSVEIEKLHAAPYEEATMDGGIVQAQVIQINRFGSIHLNILHHNWDELQFRLGDKIRVRIASKEVTPLYARTFGEVPKGECVILKDDYGRIEIARNMARFVDQYSVTIGQQVQISLQSKN